MEPNPTEAWTVGEIPSFNRLLTGEVSKWKPGDLGNHVTVEVSWETASAN
jgi:hypothetical protein